MKADQPSFGLKSFCGKEWIIHFGFLQAKQIRLRLLQPSQHLIQA
jgi:hypothetical protein